MGILKSRSPIEETLKPTDEEKKKKRKSPLKRKSKEERKKSKRRKTLVFGATLFLMVVALFIYSISFLLAPSYTLKAKIRTTRGGYELVYDLCTAPRNLLPDNIEIGDTVYMRDNGTVSYTTKDSIRMKVIGIENGSVSLEFDIVNVPTFVSTTDMKTIVKTPDGSNVYSYIYVVGKVMGGKFTLQKLYF